MRYFLSCLLVAAVFSQAPVGAGQDASAGVTQAQRESRAGEQGRIVCRCYGVTDRDIARCVRENNLTTVDQVVDRCKAGGACGRCKRDIQEIIRQVRSENK